jgi:hypothetical protein
MNTEPFKTCPNCKHIWPTLENFLDDPAIELAGYQVHFEDIKGGLFLFSHTSPECRTTLAIQVKEFHPLTDQPLLSDRLCHGAEFCARKGDIIKLPKQCECQWVRHVLELIKNWAKTV